MESQGLLERNADTRGYHIGRVLLAAAGHYLSAPLVDSVSAAMVRLAAKTGCMGYVSKLDGREVLVMRMFHGRHLRRWSRRRAVGCRLPRPQPAGRC